MTNKININELNLTITFRPGALAPTLSQKMSRVPTTCLDKLHPQKNDPQPFVEYVDEGIWKNRITFQKDTSPSVMNARRLATQGKAHDSLDCLCQAEFERRYPNHQLITGFKASFKNKFPILARSILGKESLTQKEVDTYKKQIAYSTINRDDMICTPTIEDPTLRKELNLTSDSKLQTEHLFAKNSPMNGQSFIHKGRKIELSQAIASSSDRKAENTGNLRVVQTKEKESVCYAGRVDSDFKVLEQASFIFLNELKTKGKGITRSADGAYQLDYVVNSMLSLPWFLHHESPPVPFPEGEFLEIERKALIALKEKGAVTIVDPNHPGVTYQVKFNPILFSRSCNFYTRLENWLPSFFTGQARSEEISEDGFNDLNTLAKQKLQSLRAQVPTQEITQKIERINSCLQALIQNIEEHDLLPEEEWLTRDYLCKLLDIPSVYHCKSSTDRTSATVAISSALKQWLELNLPVPEDLRELIKDVRFKELFAANWMAGHQVTRYARGGKGTVAGEKLDNKNLGLCLFRGVGQNPIIAHLLPERYLKDFPTEQVLMYGALYLVLLAPLAVLFYIPLIFVTILRGIAFIATGKNNRHWLGSAKFFLQILPFTLFLNFHTIFPKKILNEDSPQVGGRQLMSGEKYGGGKNDNR